MNSDALTRTRVKICGITRVEDALAAAHAGADAVGFVFYPPSPRYVSLETAARIAAELPPFVTKVGLFVDPEVRDVENILRSVPIDLLQFHGGETAEFCSRFGRGYVKALRVESANSLLEQARRHGRARAVLLDSSLPGIPGGTGKPFDWTKIPTRLPLPVILAGGLEAALIEKAITTLAPWALDVSSGVESEKGIKDPVKIAAFLKEVRRVDFTRQD